MMRHNPRAVLVVALLTIFLAGAVGTAIAQPASQRPWLGVTLGGPSRLTIERVFADSPAATAGLTVGDRILSVDGRRVSDNNELTGVIGLYRPGHRIVVEIERSGGRVTLPVVLSQPPVRLLENSRFVAAFRLARERLTAEPDPFKQGFVTHEMGLHAYDPLSRVLSDLRQLGDSPRIESAYKDAERDGTLGALREAIDFMKFVGDRAINICCGGAVDYNNFRDRLEDIYTAAANARSNNIADAGAARVVVARLRFIESYRDARDLIAALESRRLEHAQQEQQNAERTLAKWQAIERAIRWRKEEIETGKPNRAAAQERQTDPEVGRAVGEWEIRYRREEAELRAAEARRQAAELERGRAAEERRRQAEIKTTQQQAEALRQQTTMARYNVVATLYAEELRTNPFKYEGKAVILQGLMFKRMLDRTTAVFDTFQGSELMVSGVAPDAFSRPRQVVELIVRVKGLAAGTNALGGTVQIPHVQFLAFP